jgi:aquaporin Z
MEIYAAQKHKPVVFFYEFMGTGFLLYAINMSVNYPFGQFGVAFMVFAMILIGGPITGAHYNPAITLGVYISNKNWAEDISMLVVMMSAQFSGAFAGCLLANLSLYTSSKYSS